MTENPYTLAAMEQAKEIDTNKQTDNDPPPTECAEGRKVPNDNICPETALVTRKEEREEQHEMRDGKRKRDDDDENMADKKPKQSSDAEVASSTHVIAFERAESHVSISSTDSDHDKLLEPCEDSVDKLLEPCDDSVEFEFESDVDAPPSTDDNDDDQMSDATTIGWNPDTE